MAGTPLTEERFLAFFVEFEKKLEKRFEQIDNKFEQIYNKFEQIDNKFEQIDNKFEQIDKKLSLITTQITELKRFQIHESNAIEFDLQEVLRKWFKNYYPLMTVQLFDIKHLHDPYTYQELTELDAAFLLTPYKPNPNTSRLKEKGLPFISKQQKYPGKNIFIIAEAKHYITKDKIYQKLNQFEQILSIVRIAKQIQSETSVPKIHPKFIMSIQRDKYIANIDESYIFFGAAYWEKDLMRQFENDVDTWNTYSSKLKNTDKKGKLRIYTDMIRLEQKWHPHKYISHIPVLTNQEIEELTKLDGVLSHVRFIKPSGDRYVVAQANEPIGIAQIPLQGGRQTRKNKNI
jgi:hypothetical protein